MILLSLNQEVVKSDFKWVCFLKVNWLSFIINMLIGVAFVLAKDDLTSLYPITFFSCFMLGLGGQSILKKITTMFDKNIETKVGINS